MTFRTLTVIESVLVAEKCRRELALKDAMKAYDELIDSAPGEPDEEKRRTMSAWKSETNDELTEIINALNDFRKTDWR